MFAEPSHNDRKSGWIEVICGCMFSGKTEELIRRINRAKIAHQSYKVFKPQIDTRYHTSEVVSHNATRIDAIAIKTPNDIFSFLSNEKVIAIDEAQFFDESIVEVCNTLANKGLRVIVVGLDMDYRGRPFGSIPYLLATAEYITKLHAICSISGEPASFSHRTDQAQTTVFLGAKNEYEARSRKFFYPTE